MKESVDHRGGGDLVAEDVATGRESTSPIRLDDLIAWMRHADLRADVRWTEQGIAVVVGPEGRTVALVLTAARSRAAIGGIGRPSGLRTGYRLHAMPDEVMCLARASSQRGPSFAPSLRRDQGRMPRDPRYAGHRLAVGARCLRGRVRRQPLAEILQGGRVVAGASQSFAPGRTRELRRGVRLSAKLPSRVARTARLRVRARVMVLSGQPVLVASSRQATARVLGERQAAAAPLDPGRVG